MNMVSYDRCGYDVSADPNIKPVNSKLDGQEEEDIQEVCIVNKEGKRFFTSESLCNFQFGGC